MVYRHEWHRLLSHALVHGNWPHLIINMYVLYSFGQALDIFLHRLTIFGTIKHPHIHFIIIYIAGIAVSSITTITKYKDEPLYNAVGASGAVSAVVFSCIFFAPLSKILLFGIIPMPAILFGILYIVYSHYMSRRSNDSINHEAHLLGALFGFSYPILIKPALLYEFIRLLLP